ncbi:MAG: DNA polymerase III subunit beta [Alphaproteobacteria bacterium]
MKFTVERAPLLRALNHINNVVDRRSTMPILNNLAIEAKDSHLVLTGTDMDIELIEDIPIPLAEGSWKTTAQANVLYDMVRKFKDGAQVEFDQDRNEMTVRSSRSRFSIPTMPHEDYPVMSAKDLRCVFTIPATDLHKLIGRTAFAMSTEETRYYLNGIFLHTTENGGWVLRAVATDGHRLARAEVPLTEDMGTAWSGQGGVILPRKTVLEARKLLDGFDGDVTVSLNDTMIRLSIPGITMTSKLVDGTFPEYQRVIPEGNSKVLDVAREPLREAVDRVATIDDGRTRCISLALNNRALVISARNATNGSATEEVDAQWGGQEMEIGFNSRYLLDIAGHIYGERIRFALNDPGAPALITDPDDASVLYVLMPMRL